MAKNRYRVTDEKIALIFKLLPVCRNQRAIAAAVNLSQGTVNKILAARMIEENQEREQQRRRTFDIDVYMKSITTI
jgi:hypothetical protein